MVLITICHVKLHGNQFRVKQKKKSPTTCLEKASNKIVLRIIQLENIEENPIKKYFSESNASFVL